MENRLFKEILPSLMTTKKDQFRDDPEATGYNAFVVNRALSQHLDCTLHANEMNKNHQLPKVMQYDYLFNAVRRRQRKFAPWAKKEKIENLELIKQFYGYSNEKAKDALRLLDDDQVEYIKQKLSIGGNKR